MSNHLLRSVAMPLAFLSAHCFAQVATNSQPSKQDFSKEGAVIEQLSTRVVFQSDGNSTREQHGRVRVQSDAGVQAYGLLNFPYQASVEHVEVSDVHVITAGGSTVATPLDSMQDVTSEILRDAPFYSDVREKHLPVKGLEPGAVLEYTVRWQSDKPLVKGQFWFGYSFVKRVVILDEELEISVPGEREVKVKSPVAQPKTSEEQGRRIYRWQASNLENRTEEKRKEAESYDAKRGLLPPADILLSSFKSWDDVGRWYESLQQDQIQPSLEVKAKAQELTKGISEDDAKVKAIYNYVSLRYRYIGIAFGIGRYQPHSAAEILGNQYGDCKDKHTLLASLLSAVGIRAYPALISTQSAVDADVPSPGQFNHVISVVPRGATFAWMDTTAEIMPIGDLAFQLRAKPALVIMPGKVAFQNTPEHAVIPNRDDYHLTAEVDPSGTLKAHAEAVYRGDGEGYFRYAFRRIPESQWKDFAQRVTYGARLGGIVTSIKVSSPEKTDEPFTLSYDYTLKDFTDGNNHRFVVPFSTAGLPEVKDEDLKRTTPFWIGVSGERQLEARVTLPPGWSAKPHAAIDLKESFGEFQDSAEEHDGVLIAKRRLLLKVDAISPDQVESYRKFQKAVHERWTIYNYLEKSTGSTAGLATTPSEGVARSGALLREAISQLPDSSNADALQAEKDARSAAQAKNYSSAISNFKHAVELDPKFSRAWIQLGTGYLGTREARSAMDAFQKAVDADPKQVLPYKVLAFLYMGFGQRENAIGVWQKLQGVAPDDPDMMGNLGLLYMMERRYGEAETLYQSAVKIKPSDASAQLSLGTVQLRLHKLDQGFETLRGAIAIDSSVAMLNDVAYELSESDTHLRDALQYSQRSVKETEERSQKTNVANVEKADRVVPLQISAYWDTLGWIYFKMGDTKKAEHYLDSAWQLSQDGIVGDHLGQLYEKEKKLPKALHMYNLALETNPQLQDVPVRMRNLAKVPLPKDRLPAKDELSRMRTVKLDGITKQDANAEFDVLVVNGKIEEAHFASGSELLRGADGSLKKSSFEESFPPDSAAHLLRKGTISCKQADCNFVFHPIAVAAEKN